MIFPFNIRTGLFAWNEAFFHEGTFQPDPKQSAEVNRGAYLVQGLGHCGECHNGHGVLGAGAAAKPPQGGPIQDWYAPNLTSDVHEGIGKYSVLSQIWPTDPPGVRLLATVSAAST